MRGFCAGSAKRAPRTAQQEAMIEAGGASAIEG
jgi:hypothetical protein